MQLSLDVIDSLRETALYIGGVLSEAEIPDNRFYNAVWNKNPKYDITDNQLVVHTGAGKIAFADIRPHKVISLEIGDTVEFNKQVEDIHLDTYTNDSSEPMNREETFREEHERTEQLDILSEVQAAIKEKVGASYAGFNAEVEMQLSAKLGVNHSNKVVNKDERTTKQSITIPPYTETEYTQEHSISDISQSVKMTCELNSKVIIDGVWYTKIFESFDNLTLYMRGGGGSFGNCPQLDAFVLTRKFEAFDLDAEVWGLSNKRRIFTIEKERISRNVRTGKIVRKDTNIVR